MIHLILISVLGSCCETLLVQFGMAAVNDLGTVVSLIEFNEKNTLISSLDSNRKFYVGESLYSFHSTVSSCMLTTFVLLISYIISAKTYGLIRQSIFVSSKFIFYYSTHKYLKSFKPVPQ